MILPKSGKDPAKRTYVFLRKYMINDVKRVLREFSRNSLWVLVLLHGKMMVQKKHLARRISTMVLGVVVKAL